LPISPDEQQREQVAVRGHHVDGGGHPLLALVQLDLAPVGVLVHRGVDGRGGRVAVDLRRALNRRAVDRVDVVAGPPDAATGRRIG
jgi:hypothetical protein